MIAAVFILVTWPVNMAGSHWGELHAQLTLEAKQHATYQAAICRVTHGDWQDRSRRLRSIGLAWEVCAKVRAADVESAIDACLLEWARSPKHQAIVSRRYRYYGLSVVRGKDGFWYGTAIFVE